MTGRWRLGEVAANRVFLLAILTVVAGLAGTVIPALPGVPLVFAGLFIGAWIGSFEAVGWAAVGVLAALAILAWIVDFVAGAVGATRSPRPAWSPRPPRS